MNKKEIMKLLKKRIEICYHDLLSARQNKFKAIYIEGFRSRLDELILMYHLIEDISFVEACKELGINYKEINWSEESKYCHCGNKIKQYPEGDDTMTICEECK